IHERVCQGERIRALLLRRRALAALGVGSRARDTRRQDAGADVERWKLSRRSAKRVEETFCRNEIGACVTKAKPMRRSSIVLGVDVTCTRYNGLIHDYGLLNAMSQIPGVRSAMLQASAELKTHLG